MSLYGDRASDLSPRPEDLAEIDLLLVDLADVGSRYYTFVWTALVALRAAHRAGVHVVLLDRPNPLGGAEDTIEGATQEPGFLSFVGLEPVPVRHGLTVGEMLALFARRDGIPLGHVDCGLTVVAAQGLRREALASAWDRPFVLPSPNMPTMETALVYDLLTGSAAARHGGRIVPDGRHGRADPRTPDAPGMRASGAILVQAALDRQIDHRSVLPFPLFAVGSVPRLP